MDKYRISSGRSIRTVVIGVALLVSIVAGSRLAGAGDPGTGEAAVVTGTTVLAIELARNLDDRNSAPVADTHASGVLPASGQSCARAVFAPTVDINICDTCADFA